MFGGEYLRKLWELNAIILHMLMKYIHLHVAGKLLGSERVMRGKFLKSVYITRNGPYDKTYRYSYKQ